MTDEVAKHEADPEEKQDDKEENQRGGDANDEAGSGTDLDARIKLLEERLHNTNEEAKSWRLKARELEGKQKAAEEKELENQQKYKELAERREKELQRLQEANRKADLERALSKVALNEGIIDLDDLKLIDTSRLIYDEESRKVTGADDLMSELKKSKPYLFRTKGVKNPKIEKPAFDDGSKELSQEEIAKMPRDKIVAYYKSRNK